MREGRFDHGGFERVEILLMSIDDSLDPLPRRLVSLTWFIPLFMSWQEVSDLPKEEYLRHANRLENLVMKALDSP